MVPHQTRTGKGNKIPALSYNQLRRRQITEMKSAIPLLVASVVLLSCSHGNAPAGSAASQAVSSSPVDYSTRVGIAVRTPSRTCLAMQNSTLKPETPLVIVSPLPPSTYTTVQIKGPSSSPCPITEDVQPGLSSYEIQAPPGAFSVSSAIAVVSQAAVFRSANNTVQSDLDGNGMMQSYRMCSSNDGVHLSLWAGQPLDGKLLWHGYYYEASNPGLGPQCTPREVSVP